MLSTATTNTLTLTNPTRVDSYVMKRDEVRRHLINNTLMSTLTLTRPRNIMFVQRYQELFNHLIPIHTFQPKKLELPVIPKIEIEKTEVDK